jgi:hypothetical protein
MRAVRSPGPPEKSAVDPSSAGPPARPQAPAGSGAGKTSMSARKPTRELAQIDSIVRTII